MVNDELIDYFLEGVSKGYSVEMLSRRLVDAGWPEDIVDKAAMTIPDDISPVRNSED